MALKQQSTGKQAASMSFGEHSKLDQVLAGSKKEKRIQVILDEASHTEFKMACLRNGTNITAVMTELIKEWVKNNK